jgi:hypothetical protein
MTRFISAALIGCCLVACSDNRTHPPSHRPYTGAAPEPLECVPNLDGRIDGYEIGAAIDTPISYLVSPAGAERPVDVAGVPIGAGRRRWAFSVDYADDQLARLIPERATGKWYEQSFPSDAFVTPLDAGGRVESIVTQDEQALWLHGLASREVDAPEGKTLVVYQQPVALLRFPIAPGTEFVSTGVIENGTVRGLPYAGKDIYAVEMDALGELVLPAVSFMEVHRVRTHATVQPSVRAPSRPDEPEENFAVASELRRLGF